MKQEQAVYKTQSRNENKAEFLDISYMKKKGSGIKDIVDNKRQHVYQTCWQDTEPTGGNFVILIINKINEINEIK